MSKRRRKIDVREEYFVCLLAPVSTTRLTLPVQKLSGAADEDWEQVRIPRPAGLPEWGVPPPEPPEKSNNA